MTDYLPTDTGVEDLISAALVSLLTQKLRTDIPADDASRADLIVPGLLQDEPEGVVVLVHENDPDNPDEWLHFPVKYRRSTSDSSLSQSLVGRMREPLHTSLVGGGSRMAYAFSIDVEVWGNEMDLALEREQVRKLISIVMNRATMAIYGAGPHIGTGSTIQDSFGVTVKSGPYVGGAWAHQQPGEGLIARKRLRLYYICNVPWSTDAW